MTLNNKAIKATAVIKSVLMLLGICFWGGALGGAVEGIAAG